MNILVIADRSPRRPIKEILAQNPIDLICTLGDLDQHEIRELEYVTNIPKIGVYGNHCSGMYFEPLGIKNMHLSTFEYNGLLFGGFEGCVRYKQSPYAKMYTQEEAIQMMQGFPRVDIFLCHCPPYGVNDEPEEVAHQGYHALRDYVEQQKPAYLLHGHTYPTEKDMVRKLGDTAIIYVSGDAIIRV